ncbi:hypothetical protein JT26_01005 [Porphyromonas sp. COT-108 OH1349]|nr:hypothetical protein JT26_01005 [Porphyromonas sp. COT-108 OH1349]
MGCRNKIERGKKRSVFGMEYIKMKGSANFDFSTKFQSLHDKKIIPKFIPILGNRSLRFGKNHNPNRRKQRASRNGIEY